jgi:hypothetical protein
MTLTVLNRKGIPMTDDQLHAAAHNMARIGGGFANAIATAYFRADSDNKAKLLLTFGDLFSRHAPESDETIRDVVTQIRERVNGPWYALGWDLIAETVDDATLERWVQTYGTLAATWEALANAYNLPSILNGVWAVRTSDVDGERVTQHSDLTEAVARYSEMSGETVDAARVADLECGRRTVLIGVSDYGTRVTLERI